MKEKGGRRVLMLTSVLPRYEGDATPPFVLNQARAMVERGWEVAVLAPHGEGARWREVAEGVAIFRFPYFWPLRLQQLCYDGGMLINLRAKPWTKWLLPCFFLAELLATLWAVWRWKPDLLHSHSLLPQGAVGVLAAGLFDLPHVTTSHGNDVFGLRATGVIGRLKRWTARHADLVTGNSRATCKALRQLGAEESRLALVPAFPNERPVDPRLVERLRKDWGEGAKVVLFVGRVIEEKGVGELIEAARILRRRVAGLKVVIAGSGADLDTFEHKVELLELGDVVRFAGWVAASDIPSWIAAADVLAVPSKPGRGGWQEAQGLVAVEAMAVRTPVVASDLGGLKEMVEDGRTGYSCEPGSPSSLAGALGRAVLEGKDSAVAEQAYTLYSESYSATAAAARTDEVYGRAMGSR